MKLTKATVAAYQLPDGKSEALVFDDALPGFGIRVRAGGKRTWIAQYRIGTKQRRLSLGSVDRLDADEARKRAKAALAKVHLGQDPQLERLHSVAKASVTFAKTRDDYLERYVAPRLSARTLEESRRHLTVHWSNLVELPVGDIKRSHIAARMPEIAKKHGPFAANRARASLSAFFSWAIGEGLIDHNPVVGTNKAADEISRDRVLTPEELTLVWRHAGDGDYGAIVRLLILTGQRREEVGGMLRSELNLEDRFWSIGADRTKNGIAHDLPLSEPAFALLSALPSRDERDLVFGSRVGPFQGWSNAKGALDARMLVALREKHGPKAALKPWRLHDLRRTVATRLADTIGVQPHVIEAVLNHVSGFKAGVAGIYNRATYATEKRVALDAWANHLLSTNKSQ